MTVRRKGIEKIYEVGIFGRSRIPASLPFCRNRKALLKRREKLPELFAHGPVIRRHIDLLISQLDYGNGAQPLLIFCRKISEDLPEPVIEGLEIGKAAVNGDLRHVFFRNSQLKNGIAQTDLGQIIMKIDSHSIFEQSGYIGTVVMSVLADVIKTELFGAVLVNISEHPLHGLAISPVGIGRTDGLRR